MGTHNVSQRADQVGLIACLCVAIVFVIIRTGARWYKLRKIPYQMEDIFMYLALASFILTVALYYATIDTFFKATAIAEGRAQPYPGLSDDLVAMLKEFFVVQFFFWSTLWTVKWSLLFMFKKLTQGLPLYTQIWWGVMVYSVLVFIGCCVSNFTSCSSMKAWFTAGECSTSQRDARAKAISLWFSLAADLSTDLLSMSFSILRRTWLVLTCPVMAVPLRALWNLKISRVEKLSIGLIFAVGLITMATAIIRSVSLNSSSSTGQVSTTWLMLWAGIEGAVAIIVGCLPAFAIFIRGRVIASKAQYEGNSNQVPPDHNSSAKSRERINSLGSQDPNPIWEARDNCSDKSLVNSSTVVQAWSQRWHGPSRQTIQRDPEAGHELRPMPPS